MIKKSLVWLYSAATYLLWAAVIIVASTVLALRYYVLPHAKDYRDAIAHYASQAVGQRVTIGDIEAGWDGMHPYLDLYKVVLHDAQNRPVLRLDHVATRLSWLSMLLAEPRLSELYIDQPNLLIRRAQNGEIFVAGISLNAPTRPEFFDWLLRQSRITVDNATVIWQDDMRQAPPLSFNHLTLVISSPPWESLLGHHRFGLRATPSAGASAPLDLRGNVWGKSIADFKQWHGTLYVRLDGTDLAGWRRWVDYPFDLTEGYGATQFWLDFANGRVHRVTADVRLADARLNLGSSASETRLQALSGRVIWKKLGDGQEIQGSQLQLATPSGFSIQHGTLKIRSRLSGTREVIEGEAAIDDIELESFAPFSTTLPLGPALHARLATLAPKGRLEKTRFSWTGNRNTIHTYQLTSHFTGLGIQASDGIPGFNNLAGTLQASEKDGTLTVDARNAMLDLKGILRWPIPADQLSGRVRWETREGTTHVQISRLAIANPHIRGTLEASYRYNGNKGGYLDLTGNFGQADGRYAKFYYPLVLDRETLDWLDTSILNGRGENVNVVIKGYLDDFPFADGKNGEFKVSARIADGVLDYANGWPKIDGIQLDMLFQGNRMDLNVSRGRIYGAQISRAKISIPVLDADHPVLQIQGELQTSIPDALKFIANSPVSTAIDHLTDGLHANGKGKVVLDIALPLDKPETARIKGSFIMAADTLTGADDFPPLEAVEGRLDFTENTLQAKNVSASLYGEPVLINLEAGSGGLLRATASGRIGESGIRQIFRHPLFSKISGTTDWEADILVRNHLANVVIHTQLVGLSSSLPPPFNKAAAESIPLRLERQQKNEREELWNIDYGGLVNAKLLYGTTRSKSVFERGEIRFAGDAQLPTQRGLFVSGKLAALDWDQWSTLLDGLDTSPSQDASTVNFAGADLDIGVWDVFGRRINALRLAVKPVENGWTARLQSNEINGDVLWQNQGKGKLLARLKTFTIPSPAPAKLSEPSEADPRRDYPALDIVAEEFVAKNKKLGRLELLATPQGEDWSIDRLHIGNPESTLNATGKWHSWKSRPSTDLTLDWEIDDVGKTLERFGYPNTIKGGTANLAGQINWPGSPNEFTPAALNGNLSLEAKRGQFLKMQPGVGRLLGILSLQALPRRLLFDFRDVFNEGFAFDSISANIKIERGVMQSKNFRMEGPAAQVQISGETHLEKETLSLRVKVTPRVSDTVSLAALAGGPVAGAAAFVAQKILRDPLNKLVSYEYDIGGTWDDPQELKPADEKNPNPRPLPLPGK
ncbi:MAG: YhdP family protein [Methylophilaceae bacterium]|nr:YhdP family protein [Methylophilaceae bacterium]